MSVATEAFDAVTGAGSSSLLSVVIPALVVAFLFLALAYIAKNLYLEFSQGNLGFMDMVWVIIRVLILITILMSFIMS